MTTLTAPRFFPHHPHFIKARKIYEGTKYETTEYSFLPFTGEEPEPASPELPQDLESVSKEMWDEYYERAHEMHSARQCWWEARYYHQATPLVQAAIKARPPVDQALQAVDQAWEALDNALVWQVAVKHLLDTHTQARTVLHDWVRDYARPLAEIEDSQPSYIEKHVGNWYDIARKLGHNPTWSIGYYNTDNDYYYDIPLEELEEKTEQQLAELAEIAQYSKR